MNLTQGDGGDDDNVDDVPPSAPPPDEGGQQPDREPDVSQVSFSSPRLTSKGVID